MTLGRTIPILRIFDERKAKEFYLEFLGFTLDWEHRFEPGMPLYLQVAKDGCIIQLSEHHDDCCPGAAIRIETDGLDALHQRLLEKAYPYARPGMQETPWGSREMSVMDPFGNRLTFTSAMGADTSSWAANGAILDAYQDQQASRRSKSERTAPAKEMRKSAVRRRA